MKLGKTLIVGDSYSTFRGYIPAEYPTYYGPKDDMTKGGLGVVEKTWWWQVLQNCEGELAFNCSYSGSTVCYTGYDEVYTPETSFIGRIKDKAGEFNKDEIDTVLLFGGTNDSWANVPVGELKFEDYTDEDLRTFLPAYCYLLDYLKNEMPKARIICIFNTELKYEVTNGMIEACKHYGVEGILLKHITKYNGHPNPKGMEQMAKQITKKIAM